MDQRSALDSWSRIADEPSVRSGAARFIPLILSAAGALGVAPFAVMRWMTGDWLVAILDTIVVTGFIGLGAYVYRTRRVRGASILIALMAVTGTVVTVGLRGPIQAFWLYPSLMVSFYLLKPIEAIALTFAMLIFAVFQLYGNVEFVWLAAVVMTTLVTMSFAFGFSLINNRQHDKLSAMATKDPLTGAGNRRAYVEKLEEVVLRSRRRRDLSSLVLIDIDHFKSVNDEHGHSTGDQVLCEVARTIASQVRATDGLYRIGGEEFVVVLIGHGVDAAALVAEVVRESVESEEMAPGVSITLSIGIAEIRSDESEDDWMHRADQAMYEAKRAGRNRIKIAD